MGELKVQAHPPGSATARGSTVEAPTKRLLSGDVQIAFCEPCRVTELVEASALVAIDMI